MPSEIERKAFIDEKVMPFFDNELEELKRLIADLQMVNAQGLAHLYKKRDERARKAAEAEAKARAEAEAKRKAEAESVAKKNAEKVLKMVEDLENLDSVKKLVDLLIA